jgi:hypothetical protein
MPFVDTLNQGAKGGMTCIYIQSGNAAITWVSLSSQTSRIITFHCPTLLKCAPILTCALPLQCVPIFRSTSGTTSVPGSSPLISQDLSNPFLLAVLPTVAAFVRPLPRTSNPHSAVSAQHCGGSPLGSATHVKPGTQVVGCHGTCPLTGDTQSTVLMPGSSSEAECPVPFSPSPPPGTAGAPVAQHRGRDKGQSWAAPQHQGGLPPLVPGSCMPPLAVICASTAATAARGGPSGGVARAHDSADDLVAWFSIQAHAAAPALPLQPAVMQPPTINSSTPVISPASANPDKQCFRPSEGGFLATLQDGIASGVFSAAGKACESNTAATCSLRVSLAGSPNIQVPPTTAFGSRVPHETGSSAQPASAWAHQQPEWGGLFTVFAQPQPFTVDSGRTQSQHPEGDRTSPADRSMKQLSGTLEEAQHLDHTLLSRLLSETPSSPGRWPVVKQWPDHQKGWEQAAAVAGVRPSAWGECPTQPGYGCCIPPGGFSSSSGATSVGPPPPPIYHHQQQKRMTADCAIVAPKGSNTPLDLLCHLSRPVHDTAVGTAHHDGAPPDSVAARISSPAYMGPSKPHLSFSHQHQQAQPRLAFHVHRLMRHVTYSDGQLGSARRGLRAGSACGAAVPAIQHPLSGAQGAGGHTRICRSHSQWSETLGSLLLPVYSAATPPDWPDTPNTSYTGAAL